MLTENQKALLFLTFCMSIRFTFSYLAYSMKELYSKIVSLILLFIGIGLNMNTEWEIWWNHMRPFHGLMYVAAAISLWFGFNYLSSTVIAIDTLVGLLSFIYHYTIWI